MTLITPLRVALQNQLQVMQDSGLYVVDIPKDVLWNTYLDSFPEGTNEIYKVRREHDCNCCKQFIRIVGRLVTIKDNKMVSVWDIKVGGHFQVVADAMSELVKGGKVRDSFLHYEKKVGTEFSHQQLSGSFVQTWEHLAAELGSPFIARKDSIATTLSTIRSNKEVFKRSLDDLTLDSAETVLDLIAQNSLYRGEEHKSIVTLFVKQLKAYNGLSQGKDLFCWSESAKLGGAAKIRNTVIGSLLLDLSEGRELDAAVASFEQKVAPTNYKRPTALVTKGMIRKAQDKVEELGIEDSLSRRYAVTEDLTINNVIFADRATKKTMNVFDELVEEVGTPTKNLDKVEEVSVQSFIDNVVPNATGIEVLVENKHGNNFMSLIAPVNENAKNILKWHNNFSWSYNGEVTDSMKDRVKAAGGKVEGVLRFSIQWNDKGDNPNDLDAHCNEPNDHRIYFGNKGRLHASSGMLDVDIMTPGDGVAVENIIYADTDCMPEGDYRFMVNNYSHRGGKGFTAEIEFDGHIYTYEYVKLMRSGEYVDIATVNFTRKGGFTLKDSLPNSETVKEVWGVSTQNFQKVNMIMNSPNHWDGNSTGNKHWFFIIEGCKQEGSSRGFYNEFLGPKLNEHRKVFEVLGAKMKTEESDNQLSGLGFSSTQRNSVYFKVTGKFERTIKVNF